MSGWEVRQLAIAAPVLAVVVYLLFAFGQMDLNPSHWVAPARGVAGGVWIAAVGAFLVRIS